jgi:hypothetical protein
MKDTTKTEGTRPTSEKTVRPGKDRAGRDAMSPSIRRLIVSWGAESQGAWDPDAYAPRST